MSLAEINKERNGNSPQFQMFLWRKRLWYIIPQSGSSPWHFLTKPTSISIFLFRFSFFNVWTCAEQPRCMVDHFWMLLVWEVERAIYHCREQEWETQSESTNNALSITCIDSQHVLWPHSLAGKTIFYFFRGKNTTLLFDFEIKRGDVQTYWTDLNGKVVWNSNGFKSRSRLRLQVEKK